MTDRQEVSVRAWLRRVGRAVGDYAAWARQYLAHDLTHDHGRPTTEAGRFLAVFGVYLVVAGFYGYIAGTVPLGTERANLLLRVVTDSTLGWFLIVAGTTGLIGAYSTRPGALNGGYIVAIGAAGAMWLWFVFGLAIEAVGPNPLELRAVASAAVWGMLAFAVGKVQKLLGVS